MSLRTIGLIVAAGAVGIAISRFLFPNEPEPAESPDLSTATVSEQRISPAGKDVADQLADTGVPSRKKQAEGEAERPSPADQQNQDSVRRNLEQYLTHNGTFDFSRFSALDSNAAFNDLVGQLRGETSPIAAEKRMAYELLFYSQALARDGSVVLDTLECGTTLCVSELRADDKEILDQFVRSLTHSSEFEAAAVIQLERDPNFAAGNVETRRLIFPHDPTIGGVTVRPESLHDATIGDTTMMVEPAYDATLRDVAVTAESIEIRN